jgi:hypothetical protein
MTETKLNRNDLLAKVREVIYASSNEPAEELIAMGQALTKIGEALRGQSGADCRAIITAVATMEGMRT